MLTPTMFSRGRHLARGVFNWRRGIVVYAIMYIYIYIYIVCVICTIVSTITSTITSITRIIIVTVSLFGRYVLKTTRTTLCFDSR